MARPLSFIQASTSEEEMQTLQELLERGQKNGVEGLRILNREEVLAKEKNLTTVVGALWAPSAGVCWPFAMAVAFAQCAVQNGAEVVTDCRVTGFIKEAGRLCVCSGQCGYCLMIFLKKENKNATFLSWNGADN